jgi:hypothetical protein
MGCQGEKPSSCFRVPPHTSYRFPSYIGEAIDKDEPKDAEVPEHRKTAGAA